MTYVSYPEGTIWRSRVDGSEPLQITPYGKLALAPQFSPDGTLILYVDGTGFHTVSAAGGDPQLVLGGDGVCRADPAWSRDGNSILYGGCNTDVNPFDIRIYDLTTKQSRYLPDSAGMFYPRWSPDGRYITAFKSRSNVLMMFRMATQDWVEVPLQGMRGDQLGEVMWSPDSEFIYLAKGEGILRIQVSTGKKQVVAKLPHERTYLWWSNWFGFSPEGRLLILRQVGSGDIYAFDLKRD